MHFTGMRALIVAGHIQWDCTLVGIAVVLGCCLGSGSNDGVSTLTGKRAIAAGAVILTLAICAMHFTAMGAATHRARSHRGCPLGLLGRRLMMALAIAGLTLLVIFAGLAAALHRSPDDAG